MKQIIPNRYEIHYVLDGGFTQKFDVKDTFKEAKEVCKNMIKRTIIYDGCKHKYIKP